MFLSINVARMLKHHTIKTHEGVGLKAALILNFGTK